MLSIPFKTPLSSVRSKPTIDEQFTDMEIDLIEKDMQITDMEIKSMELDARIKALEDKEV